MNCKENNIIIMFLFFVGNFLQKFWKILWKKFSGRAPNGALENMISVEKSFWGNFFEKTFERNFQKTVKKILPKNLK
mgnify:CR=1 FL=1